MKPEKLTLRNIGPFRGTHTVDFTGLGDIFLVYGKTGAGKTTLFDAISYAFYSEAPGERKGLSRQMRSQFAPDTEESAVALEFSLSGRQYRIRRTLPFEKVGVRSGKVQNVAEEVTFEERTREGWTDRSSTNKKDTDQKILDLIGLSEEEFSRIVILPQGEFARFLRQNSTERKAVLSKLFPVEQYSRVTELARARARELTLQLKETESAIISLQERFNRPAYETTRAAVAGEIDALKSKRADLRRELGEKSALLEQAKSSALKKDQERLLSARLTELEKKIPETDAMRETLRSAIRAAPLMVQYDQLEELKNRIAGRSAELAGLETDIAAKAALLAGLESHAGRMAELGTEKDALLLRKEQLRVATAISGTLEAETREYDETAQRLALAKKEQLARKKDSAAFAARIAELDADASALDTLTQESAQAREDLERKKQLKTLAEEYATEKKALIAHGGAVAEAKAQLERNRKDTEIAKAELANLEAEAEDARQSGLAQDLAAHLEEGKPCPVCGSLSHPNPAVKKETDRFSLAERTDSLRRRIEQLARECAGYEKIIAGREADLRNAEGRVAAITAKYCAPENARPEQIQGSTCISPTEIPSPTDAAERLRSASRVMQELSDAVNRSRSAYREAGEIRKKQETLATETERIAMEISGLEQTAAAQKAGIEHKKARYREAFPDGNVPDDAADALEQCEARILSIEAEINTHTETLNDTRTALASLSGKREEFRASLEMLAKESEKADVSFAAACRNAGFPDPVAVNKAARTIEEQTILEAGIATFDRELADARTRKEQLSAELALWTGPDPETAGTGIEEINRTIAETDRLLEEKTGALSTLDSLKTRYDELEAERSERSAVSGRMAALSADLNGGNSLKTSFDAWILGMYLEEITAYANTRLERMSEGRYRIRLDDSYR